MDDLLELLDSKKFCQTLDELAKAWQGDEDEEAKAIAFGAFVAELDRLRGPVQRTTLVVQKNAPQAQQFYPLSTVPMAAQTFNLVVGQGPTFSDQASDAEVVAAVDLLVSQDAPVEDRMQEAIERYIKPMLAKGIRQLALPEVLDGRPLPSSHQAWHDAFKRARIQFNRLSWVYVEAQWRGAPLGPGQIPVIIS